MNNTKKIVAYIIITAFLFATMEVSLKIGGSDYDSLQLTCLRFLLGGLILLPMGIKEYRNRQSAFEREYPGRGAYITWRDWLWLLLIGVVNIPIGMLCFQLGIERTNTATAAAIMCLNPIFTMMIAHIFTAEKMSRAKLSAVPIAMVACVFLMRPWDVQDGNTVPGLALVFSAAVIFAAYTVMGKKTLSKIGTYAQTGFSFILGGLVAMAVVVMMGRPVFAGITEHPIVLAYVGLVVTGLGYLSYFKAIDMSDATTGSIVFFIKPVIVPFLSVIVFHETIAWNTIIGIMLLFGASYITISDTRRNRLK